MADKRKGWILLYRSIRDSWLWDEKPFDSARAWIDLILDANHEEGKVYTHANLIKISRGQDWVSVRSLSSRWGWSRNKVLRFLKVLEEDGMIRMKRTPYGTLLTIVKYGDFQDRRDTERTRKGQARDAQGTRKGRNKEELKEELKERKERTLSEGEETDWFDEMEDDNATSES